MNGLITIVWLGWILCSLLLIILFNCDRKESYREYIKNCRYQTKYKYIPIMTWGKLVKHIFLSVIPVINLGYFAIQMGIVCAKVQTDIWKLNNFDWFFKLCHYKIKWIERVKQFLEKPIKRYKNDLR